MARIYWIMGSATAAQITNSFIALARTDSEVDAVARCSEALRRDWAAFEIESIRTIESDLSYRGNAVLSEAIAVARDEGFYLLICERPISH
jgi:hypothetical protein